MDVNNTPCFLLREPDEFAHRSTRFAWHPGRGALTLAQAQTLRLPATTAAAAEAAWQGATPLVLDRFGQIGRIEPVAGERIEYNSGSGGPGSGGFRPLQDGELALVRAPLGRFHELALGGDGRLAGSYGEAGGTQGLLVYHLARRWQSWTELTARPVRLAVDGENRIWCLCEDRLLVCAGEPLPLPYAGAAGRFEPLVPDAQGLRQLWEQPLPAERRGLAICADAGFVYLLTRDAGAARQVLRRPLDGGNSREFTEFVLDPAVPHAIDLGLAAPGRLAALCPRQAGDTQFRLRDCPVLQLDLDPETPGRGRARLLGERYPMLSQQVPRFVSSLDGGLRYQGEPDPAHPGFSPRPRELHPLPQPRYPRTAQVTLNRTLDSGQPGTVWHRLYLEACVPPGCRITVFAKVFEEPAGRGAARYHEQPALVWNPLGSEMPGHAGLAPSRRDRSGLFEVLLQTGNGRVRRLAGRYLQLRIRMQGDGRATPAIHALRVYYPRFSYQEAYLPEHFRQEEDVATDAPATPANGADLRERLLATMEGMLTPIEGRIAAAHILTHPDSAPAAHLDWMGEALGARIPAQWPAPRRRRAIREAGRLQRWRGTLEGLRLALDIATDGEVAAGRLVLVENFRLRRTMATVLGLDMDDRDHPLTLGTGMSGNSIVGDSLILSEEGTREFLALFAPELADADEREQVEAFFDRYSHQVSVLLHTRARALREAIESVLASEMPAQVQWRIIETDHPFVPGLAPLLEVDSLIEPTPPARRVTLDDTWLGREGVLHNPLALSPRDVNARRPSAPDA